MHILLSQYTIDTFVGLCTHSNVGKVSSANRGECITTDGLYRPTHLCVWHTSNCTKKVCALTAWGKKLLSSLAERARMLWNRLPDGRSCKRPWEGWVESFTILVALLEHNARKNSRMDGKGPQMIFAAVFTVRCRVLRFAALQFPYQIVMQVVSTLSNVPL